ncbi:MAG: OmpA family protein [bacterium JZ-2024 1]
MHKGVFTSFFVLLFFPANLFAQYEKVQDHPAIKRYQGSEVVGFEKVEFDEFYFPLGDVSGFDWWGKSEQEREKELEKLLQKNVVKKVEGRVYVYHYSGPQGRSTLEVFRNYEKALLQAGYSIVFKEEKKQRGLRDISHFFDKVNRRGWGGWADPELHPWFYLSAISPGKEIYIALAVAGSRDNPRTVLYIIEPKEMELGLTSAEMLELIKKTGHVAIYGIYFDFDKADIKPESEPALKEIAKFLRENPQVKLYVVGHTDNVGNFEYNMELSRRRAEAVVKELTEKYGIAKERLKAYGVGPLAPVASNETEEGRGKNRRVELVKQ